MNSKERVYATLEGRAVDRFPVTVLYNHLYYKDHFAELTGRPQYELGLWVCTAVEKHLVTYKQIIEKVPFEILQPQQAPSRQERANFSPQDVPVSETVSGHASDYAANETQYVFDKRDADEKITITPAAQLLKQGVNDYLDAVVAAMGKDNFILSGGVIGTFYLCHKYVGLTNLFSMLIENPLLIEYMSKKILEQNIEKIHQLAAAGGDAIFIDDAMTTCDMISVEHYERFSLPYMKEMVREIHNVGHKAILIYFGGISDRLDQIASIGADGLSIETSMKGYVNDISEIADRIGDKVTLFGNIDPVNCLEKGSEKELKEQIEHQAQAGMKTRGFVICTGSPITPGTGLKRVQKFIELGKEYGRIAPEEKK